MDITPGNYPNNVGNPATPGTLFSGPLLAGTVFNSDGTGNLATVGGTQGTANVGYVEMVQTIAITQASSAGTAIVVPSQSQILSIEVYVTAVWSGVATTFGIGSTASATAFTAAGAVDGSALGRVSVTPGTSLTQINNWLDVGNTDVQFKVTSTNTGTGTGYLTVRYAQGMNNIAG